MSLRVYNTLSREKELFNPVRPGRVGMYLCGPTVYKPPHIGHLVGPVIFDAIKRFLRYKGYQVTFVVNITDVDDKLIEKATQTGRTVKEIAEQYTREYLGCLADMGIDTIDQFPKASEHMPEIIELCKKLIDTGHAYATDGNVWFDVSTDPDYGKLSNRKVEEQESGLRTLEGGGKRRAADFALWKAARPGEPSWESPWGAGRPGWHIECSAMSMKYLGATFDMHGGGMDLLFPHHENELAQSESATGQPLARYWMHNGLTRIKTKLSSGEWADEKMSGSIGNVVSAAELLQQYGAETLRYMLLSTQYRRPIEFSDDAVTSARKAMATFIRLAERIDRLTARPPRGDEPDMDAMALRMLETEQAPFVRAILAQKMRFLEMMDDDFNTAGAIAVLHEIASDINSFLEQNRAEATRPADVVQLAAGAVATLQNLGRIIGLFRTGLRQADAPKQPDLAANLVGLLIQLRNEARQSKNFKLSDGIRDGLAKLGVVLEDRPDGTGWRRQ